MNIYVGNLPFSATEDEVQEVFAEFGQVTSVTLIKDKFTGQPRGFGFVEMPAESDAQKAIQALNGKEFKNRSLVVNPARPKEERSGFRQGGGFSDQRKPGGERRGNRSQDRGKRRDDW